MVSPAAPGALSRGAARVMGSRFAKPVARVTLVAMGLVLLAVIGRASAAGSFGGSAAASVLRVDSPVGALLPADASADFGLVALTPAAPPSAASPTPPAPHAPAGAASADDPVVLNTAAADDLRRLPGIGPKRADAILALRARLGRFHAIEDLLKVKGIGRATLKRLRPLVRLDGPTSPAPDAGASPSKG
jgi:competence protein ComEA